MNEIQTSPSAGFTAEPSRVSKGPRAASARHLAVLVLFAMAAGCAGDTSASRGWAGSVDTLADGVVVVRSPETGMWDSTTAWTVTELHRIGTVEGSGPDAFGMVWAAVEDDLGRTWVLDRQAVAIHVFDRDGRFVRTVGREGGGPGEFRRPADLLRAPDGTMWVIDTGNARYSVFDTAGTPVTSYRREIATASIPWPGGFDDQGRLWDYTFALMPERTRALVGIEFRGDTAAVTDTVALPPPPAEEDEISGPIEGGFMTVAIPFGSRFVWKLAPDGRILFGMTGEYRIHIAPVGGSTTRIVERAVTPLAVTAGQRDAAIERMRSIEEQGLRFDPSVLPDEHPAIDTFLVDDLGYLWVRPHRPFIEGDNEIPGLRLVAWDIFDPDGRYLGRLDDLPPDLSVHGSSVTGRTVDELGVAYVVRYRLVR